MAVDGMAVGDTAVNDVPNPAVWLRLRHETEYRYASHVEGAQHVAHLRPRETPWQQVRDWRLSIDPVPDAGIDLPDGVRETFDVWGNARQTFAHASVYDRLRVVSTFEAGLHAPPVAPKVTGRPWREVARDLRYRAGPVSDDDADEDTDHGAVEFALASPLAPCADALAGWALPSAHDDLDVAGLSRALMSRVHAEFRYRPHTTSVATGALDALALKHGVCQDFAHVMIGALRSLGLAARYVSGYLLTRPAPGQPRLIGADASHAWVQAWCPPWGWLAFDPTNDCLAGQDHVTLAWGRDYADIAPLRGVIRGGGALPRVAVAVEPLKT